MLGKEIEGANVCVCEREVIICADFWTVTGNEMPVLCYFIIGFWAPGERIHTEEKRNTDSHTYTYTQGRGN